jgi:hypothetical protein
MHSVSPMLVHLHGRPSNGESYTLVLDWPESWAQLRTRALF